jgi:hypothetical protein
VSAVPALMRHRSTPQEIVEVLNAISRTRSLDESESLLLERSLLLMDGKRIPPGLTRALTRHGIKRDMRRYA